MIRGIGAASLVSLIAVSVAQGVGIVFIAESIARQIAAFASGEDPSLWLLLGAVGVLLRSSAIWLRAVFSRRAAVRAKTKIRAKLLRRMVSGDAPGGGFSVLATEGLDSLDNYYEQAIPAMVSGATIPLLVLARLIGADLLSVIVLALTIPLVPIFMALIGLHTRDKVTKASEALTRLADHLVELARGLPVLVGLGRFREQLGALDRLQSEYRIRTVHTLRTAFLSALALELIATISVAVVAVFLGVRLISGEISLASALLVLLLAPECFTALREIGSTFHASQDGLAALDKTKELLGDDRTAAKPALGKAGLHGLSVSYPNRGVVLKNLTLIPKPGLVIALTGPSGTGKSTALAALVGALPVDAQIAGVVTGDQRNTAYAAQSPHFACETLAEELDLAGVEANKAHALAVELGIGGLLASSLSELSPGERRRAAIARALARVDLGAQLLVLDEPTAHLDQNSATLVRQAVWLRSKQVATVLVSHEDETVALADERQEISGEIFTKSPEYQDFSTPHAVPSARVRARQSAPTGNRWRTFLGVLTSSAGRWLGAALAGAVATGFGLALTGVSGWLIVRAGEGAAIMYLLVAIVGVRFFGLARPVGRYLERLYSHDAVFRLTDALRLRLWRKLAAQGPAMRGLLGSGTVLDVLVREPAELREQLPRIIPPIFTGIVTGFGVWLTVFLLAPPLAGVVLLMIGATVTLAILLSLTTAGKTSGQQVLLRAALVTRVSKLGVAASELRGMGLAETTLNKIGELDARLSKTELRSSFSAGLSSAITVVGLAGLAIFLPGLAYGLAVSLPTTTLTLVVLLCIALIEPVDGLSGAVSRIPVLIAVLGRISPVFEVAESAGGTRRVVQSFSEIRARNISRVLPGGEELFADVSFGLTRGEKLWLSGPSGSGKSTLLAMLMGLIRPDSGEIFADQIPLGELNLSDWASHVAWCPQEAHVFDSTIRGNLLLGRSRDDRPSDAELIRVLGQAGLATFFAALADGLETRVGQAGYALSGGERQRLALARALLSRAEVLLLDEPTAHLDEPTAHALLADIRAASEDKFLVLVSHRLSDHAGQKHPKERTLFLAFPNHQQNN